MKRWYSRSSDVKMKDNEARKEYHRVGKMHIFETDSKTVKDKIEKFYKELMDEQNNIDDNVYLSEVGKYAAEFARNHGISISEALRRPMVKAFAEIQGSVNYCTGER